MGKGVGDPPASYRQTVDHLNAIPESHEVDLIAPATGDRISGMHTFDRTR